MTYLEEWLYENDATIDDFNQQQEDLDGFCPRDKGVDDGCDPYSNCYQCWGREAPSSVFDDVAMIAAMNAMNYTMMFGGSE